MPTDPTHDAPGESAPDADQDHTAIPDEPATEVSTPEPDGARVSEAGHGYVGRTMDDRLKSSPRETDGEDAVVS